MADLSTLFAAYIVTLKAAAPTAKDVTTLVTKDLPTVIAGAATEVDDRNTLYAVYLG
jgi:hypothetical protein